MVDHRNIPSLDELSPLIGVPLTVDTLGAGDFAFLDKDGLPVGIERCEIGNLLQKLRSGELELQLARCDELYNVIYLLVEGVFDHYGGLMTVYKASSRGYFRTYIYPTIRYDYATALLIRMDELGIRVIYAANFECSMMVVKSIYQQRTKPEEQHSLFKKLRPVRLPVKLSANPAVPKLLTLCPRLSEKVAIRLIHRYDSIWNVLNASDDDLLEVEGFGRGLLNNLKKGVGKG